MRKNRLLILLSAGAKYPLAKGLGATEMISAATITYDDCNTLGSVGVPLVKVNCKIVDINTGDELSYQQEGEICFSGSTLMLGYYGKENETECIIKKDSYGIRWIHTGDLGYINDKGVLFVTGRIKRILMTRGNDGQITKLFPDRIENAILEYPAVGLCCVIGIADTKRIHYPKAIIVLNRESVHEKKDKITDEIRALCKEKLPDYMVPEIIEYRNDLPRTSRGKVDYRALEQEAENRE